MSAENLRMGLLGAIRYGKCMIIDFDNMDMFDALQTFVNNVKSDLFEAILSKKGNFELCASSIWTFLKINFK